MKINENEKKRIRTLYGLITENVPPQESEIIAKKNPYKYEEYKTARRGYSEDLVDGDLFYNKEEIDKYIKENSKEIEIDSLRDNIKDKKIRISIGVYIEPAKLREDFVGTFQILNVFRDGYSQQIDFFLKDLNNSSNNTYDYRLKFTRSNEFTITPNDENSEVMKKFKQYILNNNEESLKKLKDLIIQNRLDTLSKVENLDDDLFEIRKVKKIKVDF